ncbi:MAG TPA: hypothetical protein VMF31_13600 [Solirubrobacterales bacterium]|nr:hypothetical protein [Solirubrobacterales bacterium]
MNTAVSSSSHKGVTRGRAAIAALLAICALGMAWSVSGAKAAQGDPFQVDFNYVGLNVEAGPAELNEMVLDPTTEDSEGNLLGALEMRGVYDDNAGNFTLPKATGLEFPDAKLEIEGAEITGKLGLVEDAKGNYNSSTGVMTLTPKISLTLGTPNVRDFPPDLLAIVGGMLPPGSAPYPLACEFSPLAVSLSTANKWPSPGTTFANPAEPLPSEGAVSGAWTTKPKVKVIEGGTMCTLIGSLIKPVGGLWMANSATAFSGMPPATGPKPPADVCLPTETGTPPDCKPKEIKCDPPQTGIKPNCIDPPDEKSAEITKVAITPAKGTIKAGKSLKIKVKVTNTGDLKSGPIKVALKSTNKQVTLPKTITVDVAAGATATKTVTVKAGKKAKGKATISAKYGSKSGKSVLTVKKAKKAKK